MKDFTLSNQSLVGPYLENTQGVVWTDSECVLNQLTSKKPLYVFVQNRITEINSEKDIEFRYISPKENPADIPSRGMNSTNLKNCTLQQSGPEWLKEDSELWLTWNIEKIDQGTIDKIKSEVKGSKVLHEATIISQDTNQENESQITRPFEIDEEQFSSYSKVMRITAQANRFIQNLKRIPTPKEALTADAIAAEKTQWIKYLQRKHFLCVENGKMKLNGNNQLNLRLDDDGLIKCQED